MDEPGARYTEVVLVKGSDLVINIRGQACTRFLADSRIVSRSSQIWAKLVDDSRREARPIGLFGEPKYYGLALSIMHGKLEDVPTYLTIDEIFNLISVTESKETT